MKKIVSILAFSIFSVIVSAQSGSIIGRWAGIFSDGTLTEVYLRGGRGIWKYDYVWQTSGGTGTCQCSISVSTPITWKLKGSGKIDIDLGSASGTYKMLKNEPKLPELYQTHIGMCEGMLNAVKNDYTDKHYNFDILFESKNRVWIAGIEFDRVVE